MKKLIKHRHALVCWSLVLIVFAGVGIFVFAPRQRVPGPNHNQLPVSKVTPVSSIPTQALMVPQTNAIKTPGSAAVRVLPNFPDFKGRPLPVAYESTNFQWTVADGKDTNVIRELAHNPLEYDRMVEENSRIFRRELVYLKTSAAAVLEQAKLTGEPIKQLTLPGVDGQELQFEITKTDNNGSSRQGMFSGHLVGNHDSLVTLAFMDGREAFTVLSPKENIYVVGEPREDGQVIVKAIDPNTYGVGPQEQGGDSLKPQPTGK